MKVLLNCFHLNGYIKEIYQKTTGQLHLMSRRPCWFCTKKNPARIELLYLKKISFIPRNLHGCWPRDWKWPIKRYHRKLLLSFFSQHKISSTNSKVIFLSNFLIIQFWKQKKRLQKIKKDRTPPNKEPIKSAILKLKETTAVQLCSFRRLWKQSPVIFFRTAYPVYSRTNETAQTKETLDTSSIFKLTAQGTREAFSSAEILDQSRQASASLHVRIVW